MDILRKGKLQIRWRSCKKGGGQMSQNLVCFGGLVMQMMQGFWRSIVVCVGGGKQGDFQFGSRKVVLSGELMMQMRQVLFWWEVTESIIGKEKIKYYQRNLSSLGRCL